MPQKVQAATDLSSWRTDDLEGSARGVDLSWYVFWTRSNCEQLVADQLTAKGFNAFLPKIDVWFRRGGLRRLSHAPMFPGYLFLHHAMDKASYIETRKVRGLVRILGERWDRLAVVPGAEIESIQALMQSSLSSLWLIS